MCGHPLWMTACTNKASLAIYSTLKVVDNKYYWFSSFYFTHILNMKSALANIESSAKKFSEDFLSKHCLTSDVLCIQSKGQCKMLNAHLR